jgi:hypothetical protein
VHPKRAHLSASFEDADEGGGANETDHAFATQLVHSQQLRRAVLALRDKDVITADELLAAVGSRGMVHMIQATLLRAGLLTCFDAENFGVTQLALQFFRIAEEEQSRSAAMQQQVGVHET